MIQRERAWGLDDGGLLAVLANDLHLKVSYGVFQSKQYVLSRLNLAGKILYCSCRISTEGTDVMLTGSNGQEMVVNIADPNSIEKLEKAIKDDNFMLVAGPKTEQKIIEMERDVFGLEDLLFKMKSTI
jgi:hypothetical protein